MRSVINTPGDPLGTAASSTTTHAALTTGVHGVGASTIESTAGSQAKATAAQAAAIAASDPAGTSAAHAALTTGIHGVGASTVLSAATAAATYAPASHAMSTHSDWPTRHGWSTSQTLAAVDAGPFTVDFTVPDGTVWNYLVRATARRSNGGVGDAGKGAVYMGAGGIRRLPAGATMHIGAAVTFVTVTEFGGGSVALSANGNNLRITITGVAGINAFWVVDVEWTANAGT